MSIKPFERLEYTLALETLTAQLADAKQQLRAAQRRIAALEIQMRREGWTQDDLDEV
jgi:multidrug resistance efflux pump